MNVRRGARKNVEIMFKFQYSWMLETWSDWHVMVGITRSKVLVVRFKVTVLLSSLPQSLIRPNQPSQHLMKAPGWISSTACQLQSHDMLALKPSWIGLSSNHCAQEFCKKNCLKASNIFWSWSVAGFLVYPLPNHPDLRAKGAEWGETSNQNHSALDTLDFPICV